MKVFILEDELGKYPRDAMLTALSKHDLTIATSCEEAKKKFKGGYELILLDHDMHGYLDTSEVPNCGYRFVEWLLDKGKLKGRFRPRIILHSQNEAGRRKMRETLLEAGYKSEEHAFNSGTFLTFLKGL